MWKQFKYKLAITLTITIFALTASSQPANAIDLEGFLKGLLDDIGLSEEYIKEFLDDVVGIFPETGAEIKTAIENETGALDLPDLNAVEKEISQDFANSGNLEDLERLKNQQDTPPPKISLETVPRPEPEVKPEPIHQPPRPTVPQRITPPARVRNRLPQPTVSKPRITRNIKPATPEYDSLEDWSALASLGSYGYTASPKASHSKTSAIDIARRTRKKNTPQVQSVSYTQSIPPLLAANYSSSQEIEQANSKFTQLLKTAENPQPVEVAKASNAIAIAQRVKAKLVNPFQAAAGVKEVNQRLFITLEEGLIDTQGLERVAPGTQLVYEIDNIDRGGIVSGTIVSLIKDNQEIPLPQDALLVSGKKGSILTANYKSRKNGGGNRDVVNFGLGATKAVGDLLNRPNSSFTSIGSFGQTQSVDYGDPNYLGSVASTGAEKVLENRVRDVERQYQDAPVIGIWELKPNTDLTITVNRAFEVQ